MNTEITAEAAAAAAAYERTMDIDTYTTRRIVTVGRASTVHALNESMDLWAIKHRDMAAGQTYSEAICGQRSPSYNRNYGTAMKANPVEVDCKKCRKVMDNMKANRDIRLAKEAAEAAAAEAAAPVIEEAPAEAPAPAAAEALKFEDLKKGDRVRTADGREWIVTQPAKDRKTSWVRPAEGGKPVRRAWKTMTKLS